MSFPGKLTWHRGSRRVCLLPSSLWPPRRARQQPKRALRAAPQRCYSLGLSIRQTPDRLQTTFHAACAPLLTSTGAGRGQSRLNPHQGQTLPPRDPTTGFLSDRRARLRCDNQHTPFLPSTSPPNYSPSIRDASWEGLVNTASTGPTRHSAASQPRFPSTSRL